MSETQKRANIESISVTLLNDIDEMVDYVCSFRDCPKLRQIVLDLLLPQRDQIDEMCSFLQMLLDDDRCPSSLQNICISPISDSYNQASFVGSPSYEARSDKPERPIIRFVAWCGLKDFEHLRRLVWSLGGFQQIRHFNLSLHPECKIEAIAKLFAQRPIHIALLGETIQTNREAILRMRCQSLQSLVLSNATSQRPGLECLDDDSHFPNLTAFMEPKGIVPAEHRDYLVPSATPDTRLRRALRGKFNLVESAALQSCFERRLLSRLWAYSQQRLYLVALAAFRATKGHRFAESVLRDVLLSNLASISGLDQSIYPYNWMKPVPPVCDFDPITPLVRAGDVGFSPIKKALPLNYNLVGRFMGSRYARAVVSLPAPAAPVPMSLEEIEDKIRRNLKRKREEMG